MSDTDSFIDEVSEEVRRDKLFRTFRKYGWIGVVVVVALVGGAAYNEWSKAKSRAAAEFVGDGILGALAGDDASARATAMAALPADGVNAGILQLLTANEALSADDRPAALAALGELAANNTVPTTYSHLAELKLLLIGGDEISVSDRLSRLEPLAAPGAPYRLLAEEQMGLAQVAGGDTPAALDLFRAIMADTDVTQGQRRRVSQLIIALGAETDPA